MQKNIGYGVALLLGALLVGVVVYKTKEAAPSHATIESVTTSDAVPFNPGDLSGLSPGDVVERDGYTIEVLPAEKAPVGVRAPSLLRKIPATGGDLSGEARAHLVSKVATVITELTEDPSSYTAWLSLGVYRALLGDYRGAEEVYVYATKKYPSEWQPYANLGDLYRTHLSDAASAEDYYEKALAVQERVADIYRALHELYAKRGSSTEAVAILRKGVEKNPAAIDLRVLLARYYQGLGRAADAKSAYKEAADVARAAGDTALAATIETEATAVK